MESLRTIEAQVRDLAARIDAPANYLPTFGYSEDAGRPFVEVDGAYQYAVEERGQELSRQTTADLDELLYWIFDNVAGAISWDYELAHRREGEDSRIQAFTKRMELLSCLSPNWEQRWRDENWRLLNEVGLRPEEHPTQTPR